MAVDVNVGSEVVWRGKESGAGGDPWLTSSTAAESIKKEQTRIAVDRMRTLQHRCGTHQVCPDLSGT